jgi:hypothetical protein
MSQIDTLSAEQLMGYVEVLDQASSVAQLGRSDHQACVQAVQALREIVRRVVSQRDELVAIKAVAEAAEEPETAEVTQLGSSGKPASGRKAAMTSPAS